MGHRGQVVLLIVLLAGCEQSRSASTDASDFEALMNGARQTLQSTRTSNVEYYGSLRTISGGFTGLRRVALGPDAVVVSGLRDQTMTDTTGVSVRLTGGANWVWLKRDGHWRIVQISSHFDQAATR